MCGFLLLVGNTWDLGLNNFSLEGPNSIYELNRNSQERTYLTTQKIIQLLHTLSNPYNGFKTQTIQRTGKRRGLRFLRLDRGLTEVES